MAVSNVKKAFILAGGRGSILSEETAAVPKPLVKVGEEPIVLSVMRHFYRAGIRDIYLLVGYKSNEFKYFFRDHVFNGRNVTFSRHGYSVEDSDTVEDWNVHIVETGLNSTTGQRVNAIRKYLNPGEPFFLTYGDSVSDVSLEELEMLHFGQPKDNVLTITAVPIQERFGVLKTNGDHLVESFSEKSSNAEQLINGGFMLCNHSLMDEVNSSTGDFSFETLTRLASEHRMSYYPHDGFWHAMDTKRDLESLEKIREDRPELFGGGR